MNIKKVTEQSILKDLDYASSFLSRAKLRSIQCWNVKVKKYNRLQYMRVYKTNARDKKSR